MSSAFSWKQIAARVHEGAATHRVWVVISALTNVSNRLERATEEAITREGADKFESFDWIKQTHHNLIKGILRRFGGREGKIYQFIYSTHV